MFKQDSLILRCSYWLQFTQCQKKIAIRVDLKVYNTKWPGLKYQFGCRDNVNNRRRCEIQKLHEKLKQKNSWKLSGEPNQNLLRDSSKQAYSIKKNLYRKGVSSTTALLLILTNQKGTHFKNCFPGNEFYCWEKCFCKIWFIDIIKYNYYMFYKTLKESIISVLERSQCQEGESRRSFLFLKGKNSFIYFRQE